MAITWDLCAQSHFCHILQNYVILITSQQFSTLEQHGILFYAYVYITEKISKFMGLFQGWTVPFGPQFTILHLLLIVCALLQVIFLGGKWN